MPNWNVIERYSEYCEARARRAVAGWNPAHVGETMRMVERLEEYAFRSAEAVMGYQPGEASFDIEVRWGPEYIDVLVDHWHEGYREIVDHWRFDLAPSQQTQIRADLVALNV